MGRGKSKATQAKLLEENIQKVKYMLFNNQKDKDFRTFNGKGGEISQEDIIRSILKKQDTFAVLPTGGGKSYCFQGPSFCFEGITLVITPLVALIQDQVKNFNSVYKKLYTRYKNGEEGITGSPYYQGELYRAIYPGMKNLSLKQLFDEIAHPHEWDEWDTEHKVQYKLLYVSPERLSNPKFIREFRRREAKGEINIDFVVVDEAHCMSQWGFDFRESYLTVGKFISQLQKRPVIAAFSATVTQQDRQQITTLLKLKKDTPFFLCYAKRSNLQLSIIHCADKKKKNTDEDVPKLKSRMYELIALLNDERNKGKPCIIYCTSIKSLELLYDTLSSDKYEKYHFHPAKYHGQMSDSQKAKNLERFMPQKEGEKEGSQSKTNIMIATKAFGMGIDRDDIELVIHFDIPRSLEDYYQEVGRAGRSKGINANCFLLYNNEGMNGAIRWVLDSSISEEIDKQPIAGRFTETIRKSTRFYMYYRMARMWDYCNYFLDSRGRSAYGEDCQEYILNYFEKGKIDGETLELLRRFYGYLEENILPKIKSNREVILEKSCFHPVSDSDKNFLAFLDESEICQKELTKIVGQVNELHINNTRIANYLRWCGDQYDIKTDEQNRPMPVRILIEEWKRKGENISESREGVMLTDIPEDAAFVRMIRPDTEASKYITPMWKRFNQEKKYSAKVMFVVNQFNNKIENILRLSGEEWEVIREDDPLMQLNKRDVGGLFPKERYPEWYEDKAESKEPFVFVRGKRKREVTFALRVDPELQINPDQYNDFKLTYFDLCVADAIYSIEVNGNQNIYLKTIWEVLSGNTTNVFSRADSKIKTAIEESINKMQHLRITIEDKVCPEVICDEVFLPVKRREGEGEKGYTYEMIPPLYRYAEAINGELIKIPVCLMNGMKVQLLKDMSTRATKDMDKPKAFCGSVDNVVLFHYLLHRIAISRGRNRGNYIHFDTIQNIVRPYLPQSVRKDMRMLKRKVVSIMQYYSTIEYAVSGGYIKDYTYVLEHDEQVAAFEKTGIFIIGKMVGGKFAANGLLQKNSFIENGYVCSKKTMNAIRENEKTYKNYDGIILFRSEEAVEQMCRDMVSNIH